MSKKFASVDILFITILAFFSVFWASKEIQAVEPVLRLGEKWTGDFEGMVERHEIRALVPYSKTFYFLDGAEQRGITYEALREFENYVNSLPEIKMPTIKLIVIPTPRHKLLPALLEGVGDIAAGNLTITPERKKSVDFSVPGYTGVSEIIVTGPKAATIKTIDDLPGKKIHSLYFLTHILDSITLIKSSFEKYQV